MAGPRSIGALELSSIGLGYKTQDELLKAANVELLIARTICSGKYLIVYTGSVSDVASAQRVGIEMAEGALIDELVIPAVDKGLFPAMGQSVVLEKGQVGALGILETFSGVSIIAAADAAAKAAAVTLFQIHVAMALGGKGFCMLTGSIADVEAGIRAGAESARERGLLVSETVIPQPSIELFSDYI